MTTTLSTAVHEIQRAKNSLNGNARYYVITGHGKYLTKADSSVNDTIANLRWLPGMQVTLDLDGRRNITGIEEVATPEIMYGVQVQEAGTWRTILTSDTPERALKQAKALNTYPDYIKYRAVKIALEVLA